MTAAIDSISCSDTDFVLFFPFNKFSPSISSYEYSLDVIYFLYAELEDISWRRKAEGKNLSSEIIFGRKPYYHDINREV